MISKFYQTRTLHYFTRSRSTEINPLFRTSGNKAFFVNVIYKDSSRQRYYKTSITEKLYIAVHNFYCNTLAKKIRKKKKKKVIKDARK